jgi:hypothetical protein
VRIRIHTTDGSSVNFDVSDNFSLETLVFSIRDTGRILTKAFYIPEQSIVSIIMIGSDDMPIVGTLQ